MKRWLIGAALLSAACFASSPPALAQSWTGFLVDRNCYETEELNVNPTDTLTAVDRDRDLEVRLCAPGAKSKSFMIVQHNSQSFKLDPAGNAQAAALVTKTGKKIFLEVTVTGEIYKGTIHAVSIAAAK